MTRSKKTIAGCLIIAMLAYTFLVSMPSYAQVRAAQLVEVGYLMLETRHEGLRVRIDGRFVGVTPVGSITLSEGLHKVEVSHPSPGNWFDQGWMSNVRVTPADTLRVPVVFKTSYSVTTHPYAADVWLGFEQMGQTPIFFRLSEDESHRLTLKKTGFRDTTLALGLTPQRFFDIALVRESGNLEISSAAVGADFQRRSQSKTNLYAAGAVAIVSGALALYFRKKGNDRFDRYRSTVQPELLDKLFNDAQRYDRLAAISFGVFQVSFIASFYFFLKNANR